MIQKKVYLRITKVKIRIKEAFKAEFSKESYTVIGITSSMDFYKVINDDNIEDWIGSYLVEEVISEGYFKGVWNK